MAGRFIAQESIDEVTNRTDIIQTISEYVPLTQKGADWWGCCPFHHEKTPSFSVSPEKRFYYCFGCHAKGTVLNFVMEMEKISYPEAIELLAHKAGIPLSYTDNGRSELQEDPRAKLKDEYINLYTRVANMFHYLLMETDAGKFALDYISRRGISREILEKFRIGYAPQDRLWLKKFLLSKNFTPEFLKNSGLFSSRYPDISFFSDRLMFPIFDKKGDVVAMGGRFLRGDPAKSPKYLNSGDLVQYKKGRTLYAFNFAKQAIREKRKVIFCEGYMDCIAYHQCGIEYAVAPLGTALTDEQVLLVKPFIDEVVLSFDSDGAGQKATRAAIYMCRRKGITVKVINIEGGKDPAEIMINFGAEILTKLVEDAILDNDYLISKLLLLYPKDSPEGKMKASLEFFSYVDSLQLDIQKDACLEKFSQVYGIGLDAIHNDYSNREKLSKRLKENERNLQEPERVERLHVTSELRAVLTAITDDISLFRKMHDEISVDDFTDEQARKLFIIMEECLSGECFSVSSILNRCGNEELKGLMIQSMNEYSAHAEQSVLDSISLIKKNSLKRQRDAISSQIQNFSAVNDDGISLNDLLLKKMDIDKQISLLKG